MRGQGVKRAAGEEQARPVEGGLCSWSGFSRPPSHRAPRTDARPLRVRGRRRPSAAGRQDSRNADRNQGPVLGFEKDKQVAGAEEDVSGEAGGRHRR